jgi:hypothetical protein
MSAIERLAVDAVVGADVGAVVLGQRRPERHDLLL